MTTRNDLTSAELLSKLHRGLILEYFSVAWMGVESIVSVWAGLTAGSLVLVAFGCDSFIELVSAWAVADYLRRSEREKADPQVLRRTERITGALLVALVPSISLATAYSFLTGIRAETSIPGIIIGIGAVAVMPFLWLEKRNIGKETGCVPLCIDAVESATCFFMSVALLGGLLAISLFGLWWVDYLATGIILAFVSKEAVAALRERR